ncbi:hypothetical protein FJ364_01805 [Candidatus Dependentiae bacterium]|nr:hypothetical protein [Candidatus Dependentiae bacterium]
MGFSFVMLAALVLNTLCDGYAASSNIHNDNTGYISSDSEDEDQWSEEFYDVPSIEHSYATTTPDNTDSDDESPAHNIFASEEERQTYLFFETDHESKTQLQQHLAAQRLSTTILLLICAHKSLSQTKLEQLFNHRDAAGKTLLHCAAQQILTCPVARKGKYLLITCLLLEGNASLEITNNEGLKPTDIIPNWFNQILFSTSEGRRRFISLSLHRR